MGSHTAGANGNDSEDFNLPARLASLGLWSTGDKRYKHGDNVTLLLSPNLQKILSSQNIAKVPLVHGVAPLRQLLFALGPRMLANEWEGVVLTHQHGLNKWKTGVEDESQGYSELSRALALPSWMLHPQEIEVAQLLLKVAGNKELPEIKNSQPSKQAKALKAAYSKAELKRAYDSALTKYDSLEVYFARGMAALKAIALDLARELVVDLEAQRPEEVACAEQFAKAEVGLAYGKWKQQEERK